MAPDAFTDIEDFNQWLVVPPWSWHAHENTQSQDAILFSITDQPAVAALGLYREEQQ